MCGGSFIVQFVNKVAIIQSLLFSRPIKSSPEITAKAQPPCFPARCQRLCARAVFLYLNEYHEKEVNININENLLVVTRFLRRCTAPRIWNVIERNNMTCVKRIMCTNEQEVRLVMDDSAAVP